MPDKKKKHHVNRTGGSEKLEERSEKEQIPQIAKGHVGVGRNERESCTDCPREMKKS